MSTQQTKFIDQIKVHFKFIKEDHYFNDESETRNIYKVYVKYNGKSTSFSFGDSTHNTQNGIILDDTKDKPGLLEIITSDYYITQENYPTLKDFASEFGYEICPYETKGRSYANKIYKRCLVQSKKLHKLFNDENIEQIRKDLDL